MTKREKVQLEKEILEGNASEQEMSECQSCTC